MKKMIAAVAILLMVFGLWGCKSWPMFQDDTVSFYYQRIDYTYGEDDGVIAAEGRELVGYRDNLRYLLALYFHGPQDTNLCSPFPSGTAVVDIRTEDTTLIVTLSPALAQLEDLDLTIACTCLARTCFEFVDAEEILIESQPGEDGSAVHVTITRDQYLLTDSIPSQTEPTGETN